MSPATWKRLMGWAEAEVAATLRQLPEPLGKTAASLPVTYERAPNGRLVEDGIEPDTLGLFVGPDFAAEGQSSGTLPPQILLYLGNIWEAVEGDGEAYREEVRTTYLHELGHYLGLDEEDLFDRGLE